MTGSRDISKHPTKIFIKPVIAQVHPLNSIPKQKCFHWDVSPSPIPNLTLEMRELESHSQTGVHCLVRMLTNTYGFLSFQSSAWLDIVIFPWFRIGTWRNVEPNIWSVWLQSSGVQEIQVMRDQENLQPPLHKDQKTNSSPSLFGSKANELEKG